MTLSKLVLFIVVCHDLTTKAVQKICSHMQGLCSAHCCFRWESNWLCLKAYRCISVSTSSLIFSRLVCCLSSTQKITVFLENEKLWWHLLQAVLPPKFESTPVSSYAFVRVSTYMCAGLRVRVQHAASYVSNLPEPTHLTNSPSLHAILLFPA